ncbi:MAG: amidohydrolase [Pseudothermotoga sp.]
MRISLENALVLKDAFSEPVFLNILIEDGQICQIDNQKREDVDQRYELSGKLIMPGLINAHTHAPMTLMRGIAEDMRLQDWLFKKVLPIEDRLTEEDTYYGTMLAQMEMARKGVVAYVDMYFHCDAIAQAALDFGMKALITRGLTDAKGTGKAKLDQNIEYYYRWNDKDGLIKIGFGPHAPYSCSVQYIDQIAKVARDLKAPVTVHLYESKEENYSLSQILNTTLSECTVIFAHCVHVKQQDIKLLAAENFFVAHNPTSNLKLGNGISPVQRMLDQGVQVCLGSDGAASNNTLDIFYEMRLAALLQKMDDPTNLSLNQCLAMATINGAKAIGLTAGRIEVGVDADLVVLDIEKPWYLPREALKSHLVHSASSLDVFGTMVKGKWVYLDGTYPTIDQSEVQRKAIEVMKRLIGTES